MKRTVPLILALLLTLTAPACAAGAPAAEETTGGSIAIATAEQGAFADVPASAWYADAVRCVSERDLMNGTGGGRFSPDAPFTRAQLVTVLYRIAGQPAVAGEDSFSDTERGSWYADAVLWAERSGVVGGVGGGMFGTHRPTTQEQLVTMLWRMEGEPEASPADDASAYAATAVGWAREAGLARETDGFAFAPNAEASRAQIAYLLYNYLLQEDTADQQEITLTVAGQALAVDWADNSTVDALRELLKKNGPITLDMSDYGGFEKGAPLSETLPQNNEPMNTDAGDVILYQGKQFVIYYDRNSWSLTPLGRITGLGKTELQSLLGAGNVKAELAVR